VPERFSNVSKRTSTRWYIGAWLVWLVALAVFFATAHRTFSASAFYAIGTSPISGIAWLVAGIAALVMLVVWIGALIRLGQQHSWGWFAVVLIFQIIGLGFIGMVAYAAAGPPDEMAVTRPTVT
jgi:hypothetical protein